MKKFIVILVLLTRIFVIFCQNYGHGDTECPEECRCLLTQDLTDCSRQNLTELPTPINKEVKILDLSYNTYDTIPNGLLEFETLSTLFLDHNNIKHIDETNLNIETLQELDLSHNKIINWTRINPNKVIQGAISLKKLNLGYNRIKEIKEGLNSSSLEILNLENCFLSEILPKFLNGTTNIKELILTNNRLRRIFLESETLIWLNLSYNLIDVFSPHALTKLPSLKTLILNENRISHFHQVRSTSLENLEIVYCNLQTATLGHLPNLKRVDLRGNYIREVSHKFFSNGSLQYIDLSNNSINSIESMAFMYLENLVYLDLSQNKISQINSKLFLSNSKLTTINLSRNYITTISFQSPSLKLLDMSYCEIQYIQEENLNKFSSLRSLELSRNLIRQLPKKIDLPQLEYLDVSMNKLSELSASTFSNLDNLKLLNLAGNRFTSGIKANYFPETLSSIILDDNLWICNCYSSDFRQFHDYLLKPPAKLDSNRVVCYSPENVTGRTWQFACSYSWYVESKGRGQQMWLYAVSLIIVLILVLFSIISIRKVYEKRQQMERRERERLAEEARQRILRMQMASRRQSAQQNAPDPRELQRPPSYAEAVLMPRIDSSTTSLSGSRANITSSTTDISNKKNKNKKAANSNNPKKKKPKSNQLGENSNVEMQKNEESDVLDENVASNSVTIDVDIETIPNAAAPKDTVMESNL